MNTFSQGLLKLQAQNRSAPREYRIENAKADEAHIYLYDIIGYDWWTGGGVTAEQFSKDMRAVAGKTLHLHVNSPGGDVFDGRAMVTALKNHAGKKIAHVDGIAASAASFLIMHCDEIEITDGAMIMIHNGWTIAVGDNRAMEKAGDLLRKVDASICDDYILRVNVDREQVTDWMNAETYFSAAEAQAHGFVDRIVMGEGRAQARQWNLSAYQHAPEDLTAEDPPAEPPHASGEESNDHEFLHAHRMRELELVEKNIA